MLLSHFFYEKSKIVSFASLTIKIVVFPVCSKFAVKPVRYIALDQHQALAAYPTLLQLTITFFKLTII